MSDDNIELPAEKAYYIQKMEVAKEIQSELLDWAKRRVWITGAVIAVVGFFGINGLVISSVYTVLREDLRNAHVSTVLASEAAEKARKTMANAEQNEEKLELLGYRADGVEDQFDDVVLKLNAAGDNAKAAALREIDVLKRRIQKLEGLVASLSPADATSRISEYQNQVEEAERAAAEARAIFEENSEYFVILSFPPTGELEREIDIANQALQKEGFKTGPDSLVPPIVLGGASPPPPYRVEYNRKDERIAARVALTLDRSLDVGRPVTLVPHSSGPRGEINVSFWDL